MSVLPENLHTACLKDADSYSDISFQNLNSILMDVDSYYDISFLKFQT